MKSFVNERFDKKGYVFDTTEPKDGKSEFW